MPLSSLLSPPVTTWAAIGSAAAAGNGAIRFVSDIGGGVLVQSNGTTWGPLNGRALLGRLEAEATGIAAVAQRVLRVLLPAGVPLDQDDLLIDIAAAKSGATDNAQLFAYIGPTGDSTDTVITGLNGTAMMGTTGRTCGMLYPVRRYSATAARRIGSITAGSSGIGSSSTGVAVANTTVPNMDSAAKYLSVYVVSGGATDTVSVQRCNIYWEG